MIVEIEAKGKRGNIEIPLSVSEIFFEEYIDFKAKEQIYFKLLEKHEVDLKKPLDEDALQEIFEAISDAVFQVITGDIDLIEFDIGEKFDEILKSGFYYTYQNLKNGNVTIIRLYCHIVNLINTYTPGKISNYDYKTKLGKEYFYLKGKEFVDIIEEKAFTVGEVITVLQFQKHTKTLFDKKGDGEGNLEFNLGLDEFSTLMRKKNELLPANKRDRIKFVNKRKELFKVLTMVQIIEVRFFLLNTLKLYSKILVTNRFSNQSQKSGSRKKNVRRLRKQKGKTNIFGTS